MKMKLTNLKLSAMLFAAALCLFTSTATTAQTTESETLPNFSVTALDGRTVTSNQLTTEGKWLLVYVEASCRTCDEFYDVFRLEQLGMDHGGKVVVVVGGAVHKEVERIAKRVPWIARGSWYADPAKQVAVSLQLTGAPVVSGIQDGKKVWDFSGLMADTKNLKSILDTWRTPLPSPQSPAN
jgi:hypothetical protein